MIWLFWLGRRARTQDRKEPQSGRKLLSSGLGVSEHPNIWAPAHHCPGRLGSNLGAMRMAVRAQHPAPQEGACRGGECGPKPARTPCQSMNPSRSTAFLLTTGFLSPEPEMPLLSS